MPLQPYKSTNLPAIMDLSADEQHDCVGSSEPTKAFSFSGSNRSSITRTNEQSSRQALHPSFPFDQQSSSSESLNATSSDSLSSSNVPILERQFRPPHKRDRSSTHLHAGVPQRPSLRGKERSTSIGSNTRPHLVQRMSSSFSKIFSAPSASTSVKSSTSQCQPASASPSPSPSLLSEPAEMELSLPELPEEIRPDMSEIDFLRRTQSASSSRKQKVIGGELDKSEIDFLRRTQSEYKRNKVAEEWSASCSPEKENGEMAVIDKDAPHWKGEADC